MSEFAIYWILYVLTATFHFVVIMYMFRLLFKRIEELEKCLMK